MAIEFTLRFPFEISPGRKISGIDKSFEQKIGRLKFGWEQQNHLHIIKVSGFDSELNAQEYLKQDLDWSYVGNVKPKYCI